MFIHTGRYINCLEFNYENRLENYYDIQFPILVTKGGSKVNSMVEIIMPTFFRS